MSFLAWIILGLLAGFIWSKLVNEPGDDVILDILLGIVGAIIGGWLFNIFEAASVIGLNLFSLPEAVMGAVAVLLVYRAIRRAA
jgi:uncharacterized membrane protein YeaQ/YmgE (transglycosylase-associated protein family)